MPKKSKVTKKKNKFWIGSQTETRINPKSWSLFLSSKICEAGLATEDVADKIVEMFGNVCEDHLMCKSCKRVLNDGAFYTQASQASRRFKAQICKDCWKTQYGKRIVT